jgi:phosphatidyl-myo-inositol alpha-mannosyltransferase
MRVALVSPYSWAHPGGVNQHVEALAATLSARGHEVRAFAPLRRDAPAPPWLVPLGATAGWSFNGAKSNVALHPSGVAMLRRELRAFAPDVVHLHEPVVPMTSWDTLMSAPAPLVGTFHTYGTNRWTHGAAALAGARRRMQRLVVRIAVSEAAAWTGRRFYGGEYRVIPNGVAIPPGGVPAPSVRRPEDPLRVVFVGQAVARKGLPVLLRAFEALRAHVPATLTVVGAGPAEVSPLLGDPSGVTALGRVDEQRKRAELAAADLLVAPSLGGDSFGMVLT